MALTIAFQRVRRAGQADWAKSGIATFAYDQRGFGETPYHGLWPGTQRLGEDLVIASQLVARRFPGVPHYILGESMGGALVIAAMAGADGIPRPIADGYILSAPAVWGRSSMNIFERSALWFGGRMFPTMTLTGSSLHIMASDNIAMLRALSRDKLVIKATRIDADLGAGRSDGCGACLERRGFTRRCFFFMARMTRSSRPRRCAR